MFSTSDFWKSILGVALLVALAGLAVAPMRVGAQETDPESVIRAWHEATHAGDVDAALAYLADDAVVTLVPPPPGMSGTLQGKDAIRDWYEQQAAGNAESEIIELQVNGNQVTFRETYADDSLRGMGVQEVELIVKAVVEGGLIQSYTASMTEDSLAKLPPPSEMPETGSSVPSGRQTALLIFAGLILIIAAGLGIRSRQISSRA